MSTRTQAALLMDAHHPFPEPLIPDGISKEVDTADFGYDALGRRISRRVGDTEETFAYDAIGRVIEQTNPLAMFTIEYLGQSDRPTAMGLGLGKPGIGFTTTDYHEWLSENGLIRRVNNVIRSMIAYAQCQA